jgi:hypothetical protein
MNIAGLRENPRFWLIRTHGFYLTSSMNFSKGGARPQKSSGRLFIILNVPETGSGFIGIFINRKRLKMADIKEAKEALIGVNELVGLFIDVMKDGLDWSDIGTIYDTLLNDERFSGIMERALEGIGKVKDEVIDLDIAETIELSSLQLSYIPSHFQKLTGTTDDPT